ncbi:MAG TPA: ABC transporter substrate-binding protein [bacterium]|nr:ABC transporter substrate-binding protein [bacterium]
MSGRIARRLRRGYAAAALIALVLTPWGGRSAALGAAGPSVGGAFVLAVQQDPKTLDAPRMTLADEDEISNYIGAALTAIAPDGRVVPWLADRWEWSPNGKTLTFHLKPGIMFHSGKPMTAADVKTTFERDVDPATASPYDRDFLSSVASFDAPDSTTLVLRLKAPDGGLLETLASPGYLQPTDPSAVAKWGNQYAQHPSSVGPFMFKEWLPGQTVTLARNPAYRWGPSFDHPGPPYVNELVFRVIPQLTSQMAAFQSGTLSALLSVPPEQWDTYATNPKYHFFKTVGPRVYYVELNLKNAMFQDLRVRQALNDAMDRNAIVASVFNGHAVANWAPFSPLLAGYWKGSENAYRHDLAHARQLLSEAGYTYQGGTLQKGGRPVALRLVTRSYQPFTDLAQVVQAQLQELGIGTTITAYEVSTALARLKAGDYDVSVSSYAWDSDPGLVLRLVLQTGGSLDFSTYDSPAFNELSRLYQTTISPTVRIQLMQRLQAQFLRDVPWAMLAAEVNGRVVQGGFGGVILNRATGELLVENAYVAK